MTGAADHGLAALLGWLELIEHALLLFAVFWFVIGAAEELAVDLGWLWLRVTGRTRTPRLAPADVARPLSGHAAVFVPAWQEAEVIGPMIAHTLAAWPQPELRLYVGSYVNDPATLLAATSAAAGDPRLRLVIHDRIGPSTRPIASTGFTQRSAPMNGAARS